MANEGSTKPTYSELERYKEAAEHVDAIQARTIRELRAELLRVRGLLQRIVEACKTPICTHARMMPVVGACVCCDREVSEKLRKSVGDAAQYLSGAESADIGKLDSADEVGDYSCAVCGFGMMEPCEHWKRMVGSAETGGEKA